LIHSRAKFHGVGNVNAHEIRPLAVKPVPANSLSPNYELLEEFESEQRSEFHYRQDWSARMPDWLKRFATKNLSQRQAVASAACSTTLNKSEKKWQPTLRVVKP